MELKDYQPVAKRTEGEIEVPGSIRQFEEDFFPEYESARNGNNNFKFEKGMGGSNPFISGLVNYVFAQNGGRFRTLEPTDDIYRKPSSIIKYKSYTDLNAFDVWLTEPQRGENKGIWKQLHSLAEKHLGRNPKGSFRVQGYYAIPNEKGDTYYDALILPGKNFRIIDPLSIPEYDEKNPLDLRTRFNSLDKNGMVIPDVNGKFIKHSLGNGVTRVFLGRKGLSSFEDDLAYYDNGGLVVVVGA